MVIFYYYDVLVIFCVKWFGVGFDGKWKCNFGEFGEYIVLGEIF